MAKGARTSLNGRYVRKHNDNYSNAIVYYLSQQVKYSQHIPHDFTLQAGVTNDAKLTFVDTSIYCDAGDDPMESGVGESVHFAQNAYNANAWSVKPYTVLTDCMWNTPCRAPGSTQVCMLLVHK